MAPRPDTMTSVREIPASTVVEEHDEDRSIQSEVLNSKPDKMWNNKRATSIVKNSIMVDDSSVGSESSPGSSGATSSVGSTAQRMSGSFSLKASVEARWVELSKRSVFLFLFCVAATCAGVTYMVTSNAEEDAMTEQFESFASEIVGVSSINMINIYASIASMALTVTSYAEDTEIEWPFVTIPHFELRGEQLLQLSGAKYVSMGVLVNETDKEEWHNYSVANQGWIQQGLDIQDNGEVADDITPYIKYRVPTEDDDSEGEDDMDGLDHSGHDMDMDDHSGHRRGRRRRQLVEHDYLRDEGPADPYYGVVWQMAPARPSPTMVNYNALSTRFSDLVKRMETTRLEVLSGIIIDEEDAFFESTIEGESSVTPESYLVQPVFRKVTGTDGDSDLVGYLTALLPWENYFQNIIPDGTAPLHLVLSNTCGDVATYEIRGSQVKLLSATKDVHDTLFEALGVNAHFNALQHEAVSNACGDGEEMDHVDVDHGDMDHGDMDMVDPGADMGMDHGDMGHGSATMDQGDMDPGMDMGMDQGSDMTMGNETMPMMEDGGMVPGNETMSMTPANSQPMNMNGGSNRRQRRHAEETHDISSGCNGEFLVHTEETHDILAQQDVFFCWYDFTIYPTQEFQDAATSKEPIYITLGVIVIFLLTSLVFLGYDVLVTRRQRKVEAHAAKSNAIVSSLFPEQVRQRLMENNSKPKSPNKSGSDTNNNSSNMGYNFAGQVNALNNGSSSNDTANKLLQTKPIADLFPNATVLFADICGFTAWSSTREPSQTFTLLEQIYNAFDMIAKRRRIFKVETIGDCYVAAAGLPEPRPDHAIAMARFSSECMGKMHAVVQSLEVLLGPGTADLSMRFGMHSGPVTAGVLRGEKSRFQLFGDTVNTASRIETTGERDRIHVSESTAQLLLEAGKKSWLQKRDEVVTAKGKGDMTTYWLLISKGGKNMDQSFATLSSHSGGRSVSSTSSSVQEFGGSVADLNAKISTRNSADTRMHRLVQWNVDVMQRFLRKIEAKRRSEESKEAVADIELIAGLSKANFVLDEVKEIVELPQNDSGYSVNPHEISLDPAVVSQLEDYVSMICDMYRNNSFHNFEHASHVTQSVAKLLSRIVTTDDINYDDLSVRKKAASQLHEYTFGITSDPITQFACAFSALIHDVDHDGVPNAVLVDEKTDIALMYENKSVAEQNSVDLAWELLMDDGYQDLRKAIYQDADELKRFRQLVVNSVMATDIADKELGNLRKARWAKAFDDVPENKCGEQSLRHSSSTGNLMECYDDTNRKATIVIEHLIQASDVSHTMQHWHVYLKWNEKLFHEMYKAFQQGRSTMDPSEGWYKGEIGFFDFYIIPLAKKLKECGVFGVSSDEYLQYAVNNRNEWETKGKQIVEDYMTRYKK